MANTRSTLLALSFLTLAIAPSTAHAQSAAPSEPTANDLVRARVSLVGALRGCLPNDGWSIRMHAAFDPRTGRLTATAPDGVTWSPDEQRCIRRATPRVRVARFAAGAPFETDFTLDGRDPRGELLRTVDVVACLPSYNADRCHLNVAVATNARRPQLTSGVTWDVQGCIPNAAQLACVEAAIGRIAWPVRAGDPASFHGRVGPSAP